ncbi:GNAT family N-acetyltransferase [Paenibacillus sp. OAS669]|uniref:GNAT family N-acetyltransferase n=1 Tax=Paenibacillus sp. OAS669 TaxID=2663821 RepID=UPI0019E04E6F|nr:GNAT family N-acetyltransferase [Paenibacillus sp. OAS669]MBE1442398.1 ribosomal protein S18 acetylase RimI-like enzyme [Paenibacillus sp. OAS669]
MIFRELDELDEKLKAGMEALRGTMIVSRGRVHILQELPGFAAMIGDEIQGLITYHLREDECEIVSLDSKIEGKGLGTKLIQLVIEKARQKGCRRVWLITSNDNTKAIRFYQKRGFDLKAVYPDAITEARKIKPSIPWVGYDGIPVRHEVEFEYRVTQL